MVREYNKYFRHMLTCLIYGLLNVGVDAIYWCLSNANLLSKEFSCLIYGLLNVGVDAIYWCLSNLSDLLSEEFSLN